MAKTDSTLDPQTEAAVRSVVKEAMAEEMGELKSLISQMLGVQKKADPVLPEAVEEPITISAGPWEFTNMTPAQFIIPDLGSRFGDNFESECFMPFESKNLADFYPEEELKRSRYLKKSVGPALHKGILSQQIKTQHGDRWEIKPEYQALSLIKEHPLSKLARQHLASGTSFVDPTSGTGRKLGSGPYDQRLREVLQAEGVQEMESRAGYVETTPGEAPMAPIGR